MTTFEDGPARVMTEGVRRLLEERRKVEQECHNSVPADRPWKVQIHGGPGQKSFEISVINAREVDSAQLAYGWFDARKLLITHNGGPCDWPLTELVWDKMVKAAYEVAEKMNDAAPSQLGSPRSD